MIYILYIQQPNRNPFELPQGCMSNFDYVPEGQWKIILKLKTKHKASTVS